MSEGSNHLLEHYGSQLPSMVKVVLNKIDGKLHKFRFRE